MLIIFINRELSSIGEKVDFFLPWYLPLSIACAICKYILYQQFVMLKFLILDWSRWSRVHMIRQSLLNGRLK